MQQNFMETLSKTDANIFQPKKLLSSARPFGQAFFSIYKHSGIPGELLGMTSRVFD